MCVKSITYPYILEYKHVQMYVIFNPLSIMFVIVCLFCLFFLFFFILFFFSFTRLEHSDSNNSNTNSPFKL
jgi:uncharacterized membrane protein